MRHWRLDHLPEGTTTSRRNQISGVLQVVRTIVPGVPLVPKPASPSFHDEDEASNFGLNQPSPGSLVVKSQRTGSFSAVGTTGTIFGGFGSGAQFFAPVLSRLAQFFHSRWS